MRPAGSARTGHAAPERMTVPMPSVMAYPASCRAVTGQVPVCSEAVCWRTCAGVR